MGYVNEKSCCCYIAVPSRIIGYMNRRSCYCHTIVLGGMIGYLNRMSHYCHIAVPSEALESSKRAQLMECIMRKGKLVGW